MNNVFKKYNHRAIRWFVTGILISVAVGTAGQALYLSTKSKLAQHLLLQSWQESIATGTAVKPWPWADIQPSALLEIPKLGVAHVVLDNQHGEALAFGPGLVQGESSVLLAGHRDSHFAFLKELTLDDEIVLTPLSGERQRYRVMAIEIIDTREHNVISPPPDTLSLVTCYPFDDFSASSHWRYVVVAAPQGPSNSQRHLTEQ